ncbi:hypothetical protein D3C81_1897140 [compost metagenome]
MIAILLAATGITAGGLQMTARIRADPHIGIGGWYGKGIDAFDFIRITDALA